MDKLERKKALWKLGFNCFTAAKQVNSTLAGPALEAALDAAFAADTNEDELMYAILEFQMYSCWSPRLGKMDGGKLTPSDATLRQKLDDILQPSNPQASGIWGPIWEDCLAVWQGYCCPVQIDRLESEADLGAADEKTDLDACTATRTNVWDLRLEDKNKYFSARDVSGWFNVDGNTDPAYQSDPPGMRAPYVPPTGIDQTGWLHQRKILLRVDHISKTGQFGPTVRPWHAVEFRPKLLPRDERQRILAEPRWSAIFRIVRAVSDQESTGYLDCFQGYDDAFLSMPLFHYAVPQRSETPGRTQLGGVSVWLNEEHPPPSRVKNFRPFVSGRKTMLFGATRWAQETCTIPDPANRFAATRAPPRRCGHRSAVRQEPCPTLKAWNC